MPQPLTTTAASRTFIRFAVIFSCTCPMAESIRANEVVVREKNIGLPDITYWDPEFDPATLQVTFYHGHDVNRSTPGVVLLGQIDPATGHFANHNYTFIDDMAPFSLTFNGPEWGYSQQGAGIYYTKVDGTGHAHNFRYRNGTIAQLDFGLYNIVANYPSKNPADAQALIMGALPMETKEGAPYKWRIHPEDEPQNLEAFTMYVLGNKGPRYFPEHPWVTTNVKDSSGWSQIALFKFEFNETVQITTDTDNKSDAVAFHAPELNGEVLIVARVNDGQAIRIYRESPPSLAAAATRRILSKTPSLSRLVRTATDIWTPFLELYPEANHTATDIQVCSDGVKTFFSYVQSANDATISDIVYRSMDNTVNLIVSDQSVRIDRRDPKGVVSGQQKFIYYWDVSGRLFLSIVASSTGTGTSRPARK